MHRFAIIKQYNPQKFSNFWYPSPLSDPSIGLHFNFFGFLNNCLDPILLNPSAIRAFSCIIKILCCFHLSIFNRLWNLLAFERGDLNGNKGKPKLSLSMINLLFIFIIQPVPSQFRKGSGPGNITCHSPRISILNNIQDILDSRQPLTSYTIPVQPVLISGLLFIKEPLRHSLG